MFYQAAFPVGCNPVYLGVNLTEHPGTSLLATMAMFYFHLEQLYISESLLLGITNGKSGVGPRFFFLASCSYMVIWLATMKTVCWTRWAVHVIHRASLVSYDIPRKHVQSCTLINLLYLRFIFWICKCLFDISLTTTLLFLGVLPRAETENCLKIAYLNSQSLWGCVPLLDVTIYKSGCRQTTNIITVQEQFPARQRQSRRTLSRAGERGVTWREYQKSGREALGPHLIPWPVDSHLCCTLAHTVQHMAQNMTKYFNRDKKSVITSFFGSKNTLKADGNLRLLHIAYNFASKNFTWWLNEQIYKYLLPQRASFHPRCFSSLQFSLPHLKTMIQQANELLAANRKIESCNMHNCISPEQKITFLSCPPETIHSAEFCKSKTHAIYQMTQVPEFQGLGQHHGQFLQSRVPVNFHFIYL